MSSARTRSAPRRLGSALRPPTARGRALYDRPMPAVLIVAATRGELCGHDGLECGVGPVEAAAATARALAADPRVRAVLHVGLAGAIGVPVGALVVGSESRYDDLAARWPVVERVVPDAALVEAALAAPSRAPLRTPSTRRPLSEVLATQCHKRRSSRRWRASASCGRRRRPGSPRSRCVRSRTSSARRTAPAGTSPGRWPRSALRCRPCSRPWRTWPPRSG